jgi:hypothetical protein
LCSRLYLSGCSLDNHYVDCLRNYSFVIFGRRSSYSNHSIKESHSESDHALDYYSQSILIYHPYCLRFFAILGLNIDGVGDRLSHESSLFLETPFIVDGKIHFHFSNVHSILELTID